MATRGGSCNSRGPSTSHRGAFRAARKPIPSALLLAGIKEGWGPALGLGGTKAGTGSRSWTPSLCGRLAPGSLAPLGAARAPPAPPTPRGLKGGERVPGPHRRPGGPRRRLTASPLFWARVAKPGVPSILISDPLRPSPRARSPAPADFANSGGTRLPGDGRRAGSACLGAGEPSSVQQPQI